MKRSAIEITKDGDIFHVDTARGESIDLIGCDSELGEYTLSPNGDCPPFSESDQVKILKFCRDLREKRK